MALFIFETGQGCKKPTVRELSPLLSRDGGAIDCVIRAIDQVDKLVPVDLDLPNGQSHRARIEVPQVSWRLYRTLPLADRHGPAVVLVA